MRAGLEAFFGFVEERRGAWRIMFRNSDDPDVSVRLDRLRDEVAAAIVQLMSEEAASKGLDFPKMPQMVEMIAQQLVGAMQSLADWWDLHRDVPRDEVLQVAMDFAWMGQERLSRGERWAELTGSAAGAAGRPQLTNAGEHPRVISDRMAARKVPAGRRRSQGARPRPASRSTPPNQPSSTG